MLIAVDTAAATMNPVLMELVKGGFTAPVFSGAAQVLTR
jgi:hypothetical protein